MLREVGACVRIAQVNDFIRVKKWSNALLNLPSPLTAAELLIASPVDDDLSVKMFEVTPHNHNT